MSIRSDIDFGTIGGILSSGRSHREPLAGQIATIIRYLIATNALQKGQALPALRSGAASLRVNMHTLRRAYQLLDEDGYIETVPSVGYRVKSFNPRQPHTPQLISTLNTFLDDVATEALLRFGLTESDLADLLTARARKRKPASASFVECSTDQAAMHARQVEQVIKAPCAPVDFNIGPAPEGFNITTYFHLDEIERVWPGATSTMHLVHICISPRMAGVIREASHNGRKIIIGEFDAVLGARMAEELSRLDGGSDAELDVAKVSSDSDIRCRKDQTTLLAPRVWSRMPEHVRMNPNTHQIEYDIEPEDAPSLAASYAQFKMTRAHLNRCVR